MQKIAFAIFLSSFFLLRPVIMQYSGLLYPDDDFDYFAHATSLAFGQFPSYKNEYFMDATSGPQRAIGTGIMAAPFVSAFSLLDRVNGADIVEKRTAQNVQESWSVFGFIFASVFYFCLSCMLLYRSIAPLAGETFTVWAIILMVICQGMPLYAFRRPVFSHVPEFFLQSVFVYLLIKNEISNGKWIKKWWSFALIGFGAGLIALTRYNNVLFTIMWPLLFLRRDKWQKIFYVLPSAALLIMIFKWWPEQYNHYITYAGLEKELTIHAPWPELVRRLGQVLFGPDWGLIFTAPFLILGMGGLALLNFSWKKKYILATLPILVNFYIINVTGLQGSYYGYRYLIASAFPLFVLPLAFLLKWMDNKIGPLWKWGAVFLALLPVMSMWCWEGNALVATHIVPTFFGKTDWSNPSYQLNVWQTAFDPKALGGIIYLGGIQYSHYLFYAAGTLFGHKANPPFSMKTLIQALIIYSMPFVMTWYLKNKGVHRHL